MCLDLHFFLVSALDDLKYDPVASVCIAAIDTITNIETACLPEAEPFSRLRRFFSILPVQRKKIFRDREIPLKYISSSRQLREKNIPGDTTTADQEEGEKSMKQKLWKLTRNLKRKRLKCFGNTFHKGIFYPPIPPIIIDSVKYHAERSHVNYTGRTATSQPTSDGLELLNLRQEIPLYLL